MRVQIRTGLRRLAVIAILITPSLSTGSTSTGKCRHAITGATAKLMTARLKALQQCTEKIAKCLGKPQQAKCLGRERLQCDDRLAAFSTKADRITKPIAKACAPPVELFGVGGLEYERIAADCDALGFDVSNGATLADCLEAAAARSAERLFAAPLPRARDLLGVAGVDADQLLGFPASLACEDGAVCPIDPTALACSSALVKAGQTFVTHALARVTDCLEAASKCADGAFTAKCVAQARTECAKARRALDGATGDRADLDAAVADACGAASFATLQAPSGANLQALACECESVGVDTLTNLSDYRQCLLRQQECRLADLVRFAVPRGESDLDALLGAPSGRLSELLCAAPTAAATSSSVVRAPAAGAFFTLRKLVRSVLRPSVFGRAILKTGNVSSKAGAPSTIRSIGNTPRIRPGGLLGTIVKYRLPTANLQRAALVAPDASLVMRIRRTDGTFADDYAELPLDQPEGDLDLVVQYDPALRSCEFDLAFATRSDGVVSEFASVAQAPTVDLPDASALTRDVNTDAAGFGPRSIGGRAGAVFFSANDGVSGRELWRSDGTPGQAARVKDIVPGPDGSDPFLVTDVAGTVFFAARDGDPKVGLWKTDGTEASTVLLARFLFIRSTAFALKGSLLFFANDGESGIELWRSDGTPESTVRVKDIDPNGDGISSAIPLNPRPIVFGDELYFLASDGASIQLWKSDGTSDGTVPVSAVEFSGNPYFFQGLTAVDDHVFFSVLVGDLHLYRTDGTLAGTEEVIAVPRGSDTATDLASAGGLVFFAGDDGSDPALWASDGTPGGTAPVRSVAPIGLGAAGDRIFFTVRLENGLQVWTSDGSFAGTTLVPTTPSTSGFGSVARFATLGNSVFFGTSTGTVISGPHDQIWKSDGTATTLVADVRSVYFGGFDPFDLTVIDGALYFRGADDEAGPELWRSEGTPTGTGRVTDIDPTTASALAEPFESGASGGTLFFAADDGVHGRELWHSDGTATGTVPVKDVNPGTADSSPFGFTALGTKSFFFADDGTHDVEPWISDGTEAGTFLLADIAPGSATAVVPASASAAVVNGLALFATSQGLWRSDGTPDGTTVLEPTLQAKLERGRGVADGALIFAADDGASGTEPWRSDGSGGGTIPLLDLRSGPVGSDPVILAAGASVVYFSADDGEAGRELWKTNGTAAGTTRVLDLRPGLANGLAVDATSAATIGDVVFFGADDGSGPALWTSDGSGPGTHKIQPIAGALTAFTRAGSQVFFFELGGAGRLWRTDGTSSGTQPIDPPGIFFPAPAGLAPSLTAFGSSVFFFASDQTGNELWRSNGTAAGTRRVDDINPGSASSGNAKSVVRIVRAGNLLFFPADDGTAGRELWSLIPAP